MAIIVVIDFVVMHMYPQSYPALKIQGSVLKHGTLHRNLPYIMNWIIDPPLSEITKRRLALALRGDESSLPYLVILSIKPRKLFVSEHVLYH